MVLTYETHNMWFEHELIGKTDVWKDDQCEVTEKNTLWIDNESQDDSHEVTAQVAGAATDPFHTIR